MNNGNYFAPVSDGGGGVAPSGGGGGGAPPLPPLLPPVPNAPPKGGYWSDGKFISTDPGSAFYKSPQQLANEAAGLDAGGNAPGQYGDKNKGWYQWTPEGYEWIRPSVSGGADRWKDRQDIRDLYKNPDFKTGWYDPKTYDRLTGSEYSGNPQTYEEAAAILDYYNETGLRPSSEWIQSYMNAKYPNRGQSWGGMTYLPGSTPFEIGLRESGNTLSRNKYGVLEGPYLNENTTYNKANQLYPGRNISPPVVVPTEQELIDRYRTAVETAFNNSLSAGLAGIEDEEGKKVYEEQASAYLKNINDQIEMAIFMGKGVETFPLYDQMTAKLGDIFRQEPYLRAKSEQEQKEKNDTYGSNPNYMPPAMPVDPASEFSRYVSSLGVSPGAQTWLMSQYPTLAQGWDRSGSFTDYVRSRIQSSVNQYEGRFAQNPRFAPPTQSRFIPNVR